MLKERRVLLIALKLILTAGFLTLVLQISGKILEATSWPVDDFVEYWSAARLLLNGGNPYSPEQLMEVQSQAGWLGPQPVMMWNPPFTLSLVLPFGWLDYYEARRLWLLLQLSMLVCSVLILLRAYGVQVDRFLWTWIFVLSFFPFLFVLRVGQISPLIALGVAGFLLFEKKGRHEWAAVCVTATLVKPHLLYLFWIAFLVWVAKSRMWRVAAVVLLCLTSTTVAVWLVNPTVLQEYYSAVVTYPPLDFATPTLGGILRAWVGSEVRWLQFLPALAGVIWLGWHLLKKLQHWNWQNEMPSLLLISLLTASYGSWTYDQVVLLPVLVHGICRMGAAHWSIPQSLALVVFLSANGLAFYLGRKETNEVWYFWMVPSWCAIYWLSGRGVTSKVPDSREA
ncbi:MAG: glycosyltransferase family 87 protein [Acidobacteriota bacterium]